MTEQTDNAPYTLVVDDAFVIRLDASDILDRAGFRVLQAEHGDEAYALMQERYREVVLLFTDVNMPGTMDGFALARAVAQSWPEVSIVVASGRAKPKPGAMPDGARFIGKPFSAELVHTHLQEILPHGRKPQPLRAWRADGIS